MRTLINWPSRKRRKTSKVKTKKFSNIFYENRSEKCFKTLKKKKIQQKTDTRINYKDRGNSNAASTTRTNGTKTNLQEEIFLVRGSSVNVQRAEIEIKRLILDMGTMFTEEYYVVNFLFYLEIESLFLNV